MSLFSEYARYYNLLYADKDYGAEVEYVEAVLRGHTTLPLRRIIDIGSGTGNHDIPLARKGYAVDGIDRSAEMVNVASGRVEQGLTATFHEGDAGSFAVEPGADAAISLFHVMSYLTATDALLAAFRNAHRHLAPGGLFFFDFWYGPAVLIQRPAQRMKRMADDAIDVYRYATPVLRTEENIVEVHYEVLIVDKATGQAKQLSEVHPMRYYFLPELTHLLGDAGFEVVTTLDWLSMDRRPTAESWNACIVARA